MLGAFMGQILAHSTDRGNDSNADEAWHDFSVEGRIEKRQMASSHAPADTANSAEFGEQY